MRLPRSHPFWRVLETALIVAGLGFITYGMIIVGTHGTEVVEGVHTGLDGNDLTGPAAILGGGKLAWPLAKKLLKQLGAGDDDVNASDEDA